MCANSTKVIQSDVNSPDIQTADSSNLMTAYSVCFYIMKRVTVEWMLTSVRILFLLTEYPSRSRWSVMFELIKKCSCGILHTSFWKMLLLCREDTKLNWYTNWFLGHFLKSPCTLCASICFCFTNVCLK